MKKLFLFGVIALGLVSCFQESELPEFYPAIKVEPAALSFGAVQTGKTATKTITVTNSGDATLKVSGFSCSDDAFSVSGESFSLGQGKSSDVTVSFMPSEEADYVAILTIKSNAEDVSVALSGRGVSSAVSVKSVSLDRSSASLKVGESIQLKAVVSPDNATNKDVSWTSSESSVASVSADGKVTAVAPGSANITVTTTDGGFSASCQVTVTEDTPAEKEQSLSFAVEKMTVYGVVGDKTDTSVEILNTGEGPATLYSVSCSGSAFSVDFGGQVEIPVKGKVSLKLHFAPPKDGSHSGSLSISYGKNQSASLSLEGKCLDPIIKSDIANYLSFNFSKQCDYLLEDHRFEIFRDFGYTAPGDRPDDEESITIKYHKSAPFNVVASVYGNVEGFRYSLSTEYKNNVLNPGNDTEILFGFYPESEFIADGVYYLVISNENNPDDYVCIPFHVTAVSLPYTTVLTDLKVDNLDFGVCVDEEAPADRPQFTFMIGNDGDFPTQITIKCPEGITAEPSSFLLNDYITGYSDNSDRLQIKVTFTGTKPGLYEGDLEFVGDNLWGDNKIPVRGRVVKLESGFVDMGTSVLWRGVNMGAASPTGFGDMYTWSDANALSNQEWRIPTYNEAKELLSATTWRVTSINGNSGQLLVNKEDESKALFFPFAGYQNNGSISRRNDGGFYWTSDSYSSSYAYYCSFVKSSNGLSNDRKTLGLSVRPVKDK